MGYRPVGLLNSEGRGCCEICGTPTAPSRLYNFDGKRVCIYHRRKHTYAQLMGDINLLMSHVNRYVHIQGMVPIEADGTVSPPPLGDGGGGTTDPGDGGGGGGTDPGTGTDPGGPGEQDPTANYIDGSCN